jgi:hypothetical protein
VESRERRKKEKGYLREGFTRERERVCVCVCVCVCGKKEERKRGVQRAWNLPHALKQKPERRFRTPKVVVSFQLRTHALRYTSAK